MCDERVSTSMQQGTENFNTDESLTGVLHLHCETGTEGAFWAFQDKNYITPNTTRFTCHKCQKYWDKAKYPEGPPPELAVFEVHGEWSTADELMALLRNAKVLDSDKCPPDKHDFQPISNETWDYAGLHVLRAGDHLTIYDKTELKQIIWSGILDAIEHPTYLESAGAIGKHPHQRTTDRKNWDKWFAEEYPAQLRLAKPTK